MSLLCTVEFGGREVRVTEVQDQRLVRHAQVELPDRAYVDGVPTDAVGTALVRATQQAGVTARLARLAVPDAGIAVRGFRLPPIPARELPDAVGYEAKRLVPMSAADVYYGWHQRRDQAGHEIYLVAARRELVDRFHAILTAAGKEVDRMDLKPIALARGARVRDGLILEWGFGEATLVFMVDARPRFFRTFPLDAPEGRLDQQFDEIVLGIEALVKFIRGAEPAATIGPTTSLHLAGRFPFLVGADQKAYERFGFSVRWPAPPVQWVDGFPWQAHLTALGLIAQHRWEPRLVVTGGDLRAAA